MVEYKDLICKTILHRISNPRLPFSWGANPYRGCLHSCLYCYARYTHSYLDLNPEKEFETTIFVKKNAAQILRKELSKSSWNKEIVNLGSVCDPYQPIEKKELITKAMLIEFLRYKNPLIIATKSRLIMRDINLLEEIDEATYLNVVISISTFNDQLKSNIEPRASTFLQRLKAISKLRDSGLTVGALVMPIIPMLGDTFNELESLFSQLSDAGVSYIIPGIMYLTGAARKRFFEYITLKHADIKDEFIDLYQKRSPPATYKKKLHQYFRVLAEKYNLSFNNQVNLNNTGKSQNLQKTIDSWF